MMMFMSMAMISYLFVSFQLLSNQNLALCGFIICPLYLLFAFNYLLLPHKTNLNKASKLSNRRRIFWLPFWCVDFSFHAYVIEG